MSAATRVLGLGNDLIADDAFGVVVARRLAELHPLEVEAVCSAETGFYLLDHVQNAAKLIVVDAIVTGDAPPGTIHVFREEDVSAAPGGSPHFIGLFEVLAVGRKLNLAVPSEVVIIAAEAADLQTIGGPMTPAVKAAVEEAILKAEAILRGATAWH